MAQAVTMPQMGYEMVEGTIVRWLVSEGDAVKAGDVIAEVETDKAVVELEAANDGVVLSLLRDEGATVPVGDTLAYIGDRSETKPALRPRKPPSPERASAVQARRSATPADSAGLRTGSAPRVPDADGRIELGAMGEAIARRTLATAQEVPQFYLTVRIDMTKAIAYRRAANRSLKGDSRISLNDMIVKACALALRKHPIYNSTFEGDHLRVHDRVNVGMAVALAGGLLVPAVLDCDRKSLPEIARDSRDVVARAKTGALRQDEYFGTFSVSNLGMFHIDAFTAIVVAPQAGVLAIGSVQPTPMAVGGAMEVRQMMSATLSTDHRVAGGAEAAQFANEIQRLLEEPALLEA